MTGTIEQKKYCRNTRRYDHEDMSRDFLGTRDEGMCDYPGSCEFYERGTCMYMTDIDQEE